MQFPKLLITLQFLFSYFTLSKILQIENQNQINNQISSIFLFYSPLCSYTQSISDFFELTHNRYYKDDSQIIFYKVDMSISTISESLFDIKAYPTILLTRPGHSNIKYDLDTNPEDLKYFIEKNTKQNLPFYKPSKRFAEPFDPHYLTFIGNEQKFPNTYNFIKKNCFSNEILPCTRLDNLNDKVQAIIVEAIKNQFGLKSYLSQFLQNNQDKNEETEVSFDNEAFRAIEELKKNVSLTEQKDFAFTELEQKEIQKLLTNSSLFNEVFIHIDTWKNNHKGSLTNISLDLENEALVIYKNIQYNKAIIFLITKTYEEDLQLFKREYSQFLQQYTLPDIYFRFTHRIRKHMTENELVGIVLFVKKRFYSNNFHVQYFVNQTQDLKRKINFDDSFADGKKALDSSLFFILDPEESMTNKQLANFIGVKDEALPMIYAFKFRKNKEYIEKINFKHSERYYPRLLLGLMQTMDSDANYKKFDLREYQEEKDQYNANIMLLNGFSYEKLLTVEFSEKRVLVMEYTASYCTECLKLSAVINKLSNKITNINGYRVIYGRLDVFENDLDKIQYKEIPHVRLYRLEKRNRDEQELKDYSEESIIKSLQNFVPFKYGDL